MVFYYTLPIHSYSRCLLLTFTFDARTTKHGFSGTNRIIRPNSWKLTSSDIWPLPVSDTYYSHTWNSDYSVSTSILTRTKYASIKIIGNPTRRRTRKAEKRLGLTIGLKGMNPMFISQMIVAWYILARALSQWNYMEITATCALPSRFIAD